MSRLGSMVPVNGRINTAIIAELVGGTRRRRTECIVYAGDCAQILVDSFDLMVGHVVKYRPWHDLQLAAVHGRWNANAQPNVGVCVGLTGWMDIIEIFASPENLLKLLKRVSPCRTPVFIRRQVAGDDDRTGIWKSSCGINEISVRRVR
jgi:hypothetical protein